MNDKLKSFLINRGQKKDVRLRDTQSVVIYCRVSTAHLFQFGQSELSMSISEVPFYLVRKVEDLMMHSLTCLTSSFVRDCLHNPDVPYWHSSRGKAAEGH